MKKLVAGVLIGTLFTDGTTLFASSVIKSATYNDVKVSFNGNQLNLNDNLISVQKEGTDNVVNYMPVRDVLERLGYTVSWDSNTNTIDVSDKKPVANNTINDDEVINESDWIKRLDVMTKYGYGSQGSLGSDACGLIDINTYELIFYSTIGADDNVVRIIRDGRDFKFNIQDLIAIGIPIAE